ncbi:hypothetical protein VTN00DRAFT_2422 [Thermoascus crustaceus]|uniref:uncharacterized protein n=1 Tax=Thermoascus crustaceus TaxID=5088 RepID=UPI00374252A8
MKQPRERGCNLAVGGQSFPLFNFSRGMPLKNLRLCLDVRNGAVDSKTPNPNFEPKSERDILRTSGPPLGSSWLMRTQQRSLIGETRS